MGIPAFDGDVWHLPEGVHVASLPEIQQRLVSGAPFETERQRIFAALELWTDLVRAMLPDARFWVDGGFVTRKPWAAPSDVDVTVLVTPAALNALSLAEQNQMSQLLTKRGVGKAMGGLVDAYLIVRGDVSQTVYWRDLWSTALDEDRRPLPGVKKGYLEVRP